MLKKESTKLSNPLMEKINMCFYPSALQCLDDQIKERMKVTQAYISKIEAQDKITAKKLHKIKTALANKYIEI